MSLKDYKQMPDDGLFEKIERRLLMRRVLTVAVVTVVVAALAGAVVWTVSSRPAPVVGDKTAQVIQENRSHDEVVSMPVSTVTDEKTSPREEVVAGDAPRSESSVANEDNEPANSPVNEQPVSTIPSHSPSRQPQVSSDAVQQEKTPVAEWIPDTSQHDSVATTSDAAVEFKGGQQVEPQPHYDNILWAPNVIAPASDEERNRQFRVVSTSSVSDYHLFIYNRGGRQVYTSADINAAWDATFDGEPLPQGTYVWVARFRDSGGVVRQEKGTVTVIR